MRSVLTALMIVGALACPVAADWVAGDDHKMHWPQLPDPDGWDINIVWPNVVADDWQCSETGPVNDVHFWVSVEGDTDSAEIGLVALQKIEFLHLSIHGDILAENSGTGYSMPQKNAIREWDLDPTQFVISSVIGTGSQGFATPMAGSNSWIPDDHEFYYQINVPNIPNPVTQQEDEIYWLDVSVKMPSGYDGPRIGWKTSLKDLEFNDDAVFAEYAVGGINNWQELWESGHIDGHSLDMAFVITPEPGTLVMLFCAGLFGTFAMLRRRRKLIGI